MIKNMKSKKGASLIEYGMIVGLIAVVAISSVATLGGEIRSIFGIGTTALSQGQVATIDPEASGPVAANPYTDDAASPIAVAGTGARAGGIGVTQIDVAFPAVIVEDDLALMFVSHFRDLTIPQGWELIAMTQNSGTGRLSLLSKVYAAGDGSAVTVMQAEASGLVGQVYALSGGHGVVTNVGVASHNSSNFENHMVPGALIMHDDTLVIGALLEAYQLTGGTPTSVTFPAGWAQTTPVSVDRNTLAVAWYPVSAAGTQVNSARVDIGHAGAYDWTSMSVQVR